MRLYWVAECRWAGDFLAVGTLGETEAAARERLADLFEGLEVLSISEASMQDYLDLRPWVNGLDDVEVEELRKTYETLSRRPGGRFYQQALESQGQERLC